MAEPASQDIVTITRVLEYHGPRKWVELTLSKGAVPAIGQLPFEQIGAYIKSGITQWVDARVSEPRPVAKVPIAVVPGGS